MYAKCNAEWIYLDLSSNLLSHMTDFLAIHSLGGSCGPQLIARKVQISPKSENKLGVGSSGISGKMKGGKRVGLKAKAQ